MSIQCAILATIFLSVYGFAQSGAAESSNPLQAEATVEIQFDGEVGSGLILMTSYPASCANSSSSTTIPNSSTANPSVNTASVAATALGISSTSSSAFNTPPLFGTSRTQMINATSTGQHLFPTATDSSQMVTGTAATQNSSGSTTPTYSSLIAGLGTRPDVTWSHVFFWAAVSEIILGFL